MRADVLWMGAGGAVSGGNKRLSFRIEIETEQVHPRFLFRPAEPYRCSTVRGSNESVSVRIKKKTARRRIDDLYEA